MHMGMPFCLCMISICKYFAINIVWSLSNKTAKDEYASPPAQVLSFKELVRYNRIMKTFQKPSVLIIASVLAGMFGAFLFDALQVKSQEELIQEFYDVETATHVSPHHIRKHIAQGDNSFILIDLRSEQEYADEHIIGAVNVPAYKDPDTSAYGDVERIVTTVRELKEQNPDKDLIVYCYSIPCMTGRKIGKLLADNNIYVKHLGVGWNEWRYHWELWNHPHEWEQTNVLDFVSNGTEPGEYTGEMDIAPCIDGQLGC